ncbi:helix-turn-helix domain-containing protein [Paenibacillus sp. IB182496]|uniref:Helix-turn-helix domain-containing protein n=2 Tax=Paenibacillus sabuli TaxID=2772509 RepID=A0A927BV40_9BACL|nr:helix-turn-helix domain-containing protein [Paenibacillus sabuli]
MILSGHAEFAYAQKAIAHRTCGYLLKPIDEDELALMLKRLRRELDGRARPDSYREDAGQAQLDLHRGEAFRARPELHGRDAFTSYAPEGAPPPAPQLSIDSPITAADGLPEARRPEGRELIARVKARIEREYRDNLRLETLAADFHYSSSHLGRLFRKETGDYFNTYLDKVRIEQAKRLLKHGWKVYEVAERVGYPNVDYFHGKFRKYVGIPPGEFRKEE